MEIPDICKLYKSLMPFNSYNQQWLGKISFGDTCPCGFVIDHV